MKTKHLFTIAGLGTISVFLIAVLLFTGINVATVEAESKPGASGRSDAGLALAEADSLMPRTITVVGEGQIAIKPDTAQTNIGVEVIAPTVKEASTQAADTMTAVLTALKEQGIAERDIQTSGYNVWVERPYNPEGMPSETFLYHMGNNVVVTIRNLDKIGPILDAAIEAGANNIYGVTFNVSDPSPLKSQAREKANGDALAKAQALATLNQAELGQVISVSEIIGGNGGGYYPGSFNPFFSGAEGRGGGGGPIVPGELNMTVQLQVTYAIE